jgi:uncharacterized lipoprotein NlpE involved in copper resistance
MSASTEEGLSHRAQIEALEIGESFARAVRFDADQTLKDTPVKVLRGMRLAMQPTAYHITQRTGAKYTIETGEFRTQSRDVIACLVITRTE